MMKTGLIISSIVSVLLFNSCVSTAEPETLNYIGLSASVGQMSVSSKAAASADHFDEITSTTPLEAKVFFSQSRTAFPLVTTPSAPTYIPSNTKVTYSNSDYVFVEWFDNNENKSYNLTYPTTSDIEVYCTGFYPADTEWSVSNDGTYITREIDGSSDIMFADIISGSWRNPFTVQNYKHLQSWIKVLVSANTNDAADKWGKVTKITVQSEPEVRIDFGKNANGTSIISYPASTHKDIVIYDAASAEVAHQLSITTAELGSVFLVSPEIPLHLKVHTTVFPDGKNVKVNLYNIDNNQLINDRDQTIGNLYVLNLNFTNLDVIEGICTLNYWNDQDDDLYLQ